MLSVSDVNDIMFHVGSTTISVSQLVTQSTVTNALSEDTMTAAVAAL